MRDLMQFVVSTITTEKHAKHLAKLFMENVVLSFGMVAILVVDVNSQFKSVFKDMCTALGIIYWNIARGNHRGTILEKYHLFLNKNHATAGRDRGTHGVFLQNAKIYQYAWNSAPIYSTYISEVFLLWVRDSISCYTSNSSTPPKT